MKRGLNNLLEGNLLDPIETSVRAAGIDISDSHIKVFEFTGSEKTEIKTYKTKNVPSGLIIDGEITNSDEIVNILKSFKGELGIGRAHVLLPEKDTYIFSETVPRVSIEQTVDILKFKIEDRVRMRSDRFYFGFEIPSHDKVSLSDKSEAIVTVCKKISLDKRVGVLKKSGIMPISFETRAHSLVRSIIPKNDNETYMLADFNLEKVSVVIVSGGVSHTMSVVYKKSSGNESDNSFERIMFLTGELQTALGNWRTYKGSGYLHDVKKILLSGEGSSSAEIKDAVSSKIKIPVKMANVWENALDLECYIPELSRNESLQYATAIGLALK